MAVFVSFFKNHWGKLLIVAIIGGIIAGIVAGSVKVKVHVKNCAGGTPGVGSGKEAGCLCNTDKECASGSCPAGALAIASGAATGKCA
jgi:hypothetical protein